MGFYHWEGYWLWFAPRPGWVMLTWEHTRGSDVPLPRFLAVADTSPSTTAFLRAKSLRSVAREVAEGCCLWLPPLKVMLNDALSSVVVAKRIHSCSSQCDPCALGWWQWENIKLRNHPSLQASPIPTDMRLGEFCCWVNSWCVRSFHVARLICGVRWRVPFPYTL